MGIWAGMNKTRFELDFTKDKDGNPIERNQIIMLVGKNGSGKTALLSTLHPFSGTQDDKSNYMIIPGLEGYKEIHIRNGLDKYVIKHYYKESNKSYIEKNGIELNPNGGVRTFNDVIKEEMNIDSDYSKIGRIGTNVNNFIDFTTSERKKYITKFLPDIEDYLRSSKIVNDKFKQLKKDITYVSEQISKLDSEDNIKSNIEVIENNISMIQYDIEVLSSEINKAIGKISTLDPDGMYQNGINPYRNEYLESKKKFETSTNKLNDYYSKYDSLDKFDVTKAKEVLSDAESNITKVEEEISKFEELILENREKIVSISNNIFDKTKIINEVEGSDSIDSLIEQLEEKESEVNATKERINAKHSTFSTTSNFRYDTLLTIKNSVASLQDVLKVCKGEFTDSQIDVVINSNFSALEAKYMGLKNRKDKLNDEINSITNKISSMESNLSKLDILKMRPEDCVINTCAFIADALQYKDLEKDIQKLQDELDSKRKELSGVLVDIEGLSNSVKCFNAIKKSHKVIDPTFEGLPNFESYKEFDSYKRLLSKSEIEIDSIFNIETFISFIKDKEDLVVHEKQLTSISDKLSILQNQSKLLENTKEEIKSMQREIDTLNLDESDFKAKIESRKSNLEIQNLKKNILSELIVLLETKDSSKSTMDSLEGQYEASKKTIESIASIAAENRMKEITVEKKKKELKPLQDKLIEFNTKLTNLKEYIKRKKNLDDNFRDVEMVKKALDPTKGIPLYFIGGYLKETAKISNELLDLAYDGKFRVKFKLSESDFFIEVLSNAGGVKEDIKLASQGETALTKISISLSMIEQATTEYNIIQLDEVDATLDYSNRINFINMIKKQIEKLGIEQVFIISHNNEFDMYPTDLILLKDHGMDVTDEDIMKNKNILFNIEGEKKDA